MMNDPVLTYFLLCSSAFLAGAINAVAGGGTLLTFPALMAALSGNGVLANGTSTVAIMPGSLASSWGYRRELADKRAVLLKMLGPCIVGGVAGALLATELPPRYFNMMVPWLILTAALLFLLQRPIQRWLGHHHTQGPPTKRTVIMVVAFQLLVAIYGGYFGAGIGILMLTALAFMSVGNIHVMNALKTVLAVAINASAIAIFIIKDQVKWDYALAMAAAAVAGGYLGARIGRRAHPSVIRGIVIAIGFGLAAYYFWQQWAG